MPPPAHLYIFPQSDITKTMDVPFWSDPIPLYLHTYFVPCRWPLPKGTLTKNFCHT